MEYYHRGVVFYLVVFRTAIPLDVEMLQPGEGELRRLSVFCREWYNPMIASLGWFWPMSSSLTLLFLNLCLDLGKEVITVLKDEELFFKPISKRYDKASTIITSNKPFEEWRGVFNDDVVAAAILDRILHDCHPFLIQGKSYRLREIMGKEKD